MVMPSGLIYDVLYRVRKYITHFKGRLQLLSPKSDGSDQKVIEGPQVLGLPGVVILFQQYSPKRIMAQDSSRSSSRVSIYSNQFPRHQALLGQLNLSIQAAFQQPVTGALGQKTRVAWHSGIKNSLCEP
ncbi:hypothetical protein O181_114517 [Austropuccinia psidii MF-1]|uniref:Uncharacterized protein n=1 Tax=Austropuccinia psidii MF-1 TaxID=1389203 RepID=A0A9Q3K7Q2_9BASI|nr:hypothetical protein [Austropuccinia psidii MF-1]